MKLIVFGAGASRATHGLPTAENALPTWARWIRDNYKLLALALDWIEPQWESSGARTLEQVWSDIDVAWKERGIPGLTRRIADLGADQPRQVWHLAADCARRETGEPCYYGPQLRGAQRQLWSAEQFLSVVAGWELRCLLQTCFSISARPRACRPYQTVLPPGASTTIISFNYDTLAEQHLTSMGRLWTYGMLTSEGEVRILKPHGSVNLTHVRDGNSDSLLLGLQLSTRDMGYQGTRFVQNLVVGLRDKTEHTADEPSDVIRRHFHTVLEACEAALRGAATLLIVGYSFPAADTTFLDVAARAFAGRDVGSLQLGVIGKGNDAQSQAVVSRLEALAGAALSGRVSFCAHGFEAWARPHTCDGSV